MALRLVEVDVPADLAEESAATLTEAGAAEVWQCEGGAFGVVVRAVVGADHTGSAVDLLYERLSTRAGLRILVLPLDAMVPRPSASPETEERLDLTSSSAVSREEVYANVAEGARLNPVFYAMVTLATIVAAIGLTTDNTAAVIGAMVVAPLLGPNMAVALGLTLGDLSLVGRALKTVSVGLALCLALSVLLALGMEIDASVPELANRTSARFTDIALAVAAGAAGTLAFTTGAPTYLVGVMVAIALLPPTVACGLLLGAGHLPEAAGAGLIAAINSVALVLSSMLTFVWRGMRPRGWWKEERAKRSARGGAAILALLLALLAGLIVVANHLR